MERKVVVLTPNGRRQNVKVTLDTTLLQILEEVCEKYGFDCDKYYLMHHNKEIGLTQMIRFSGLPNNCLLEMSELEKKRVPVDVDICIQLEDGTRSLGKYKPSDTIWHVVNTINVNGGKILDYKNPVAIYMRKEIIGMENMRSITLKSLGITEGRALIRVVDKSAEELKDQASVYVPPTTYLSHGELTERRTNSSTGGGGGFAITKDVIKSLKQETAKSEHALKPSTDENVNTDDSKPDVKPQKYDWGTSSGRTLQSSQDVLFETAEDKQQSMESDPEVMIIGERQAIIYSLESSKKKIEELPDSFFDLTVHDLKLVLRDLKKIANGNEDAPLLTGKLRELEENKKTLDKVKRYKNCVIRIQFPDRHILQGMFKPDETVLNVQNFVRQFLQDQNLNFHLYTIPPKKVLPLDKSLIELDFVPTALIHFACDEQETMLEIIRNEFLEKLTSVEGAIFAAFQLSQSSVNENEVAEPTHSHK